MLVYFNLIKSKCTHNENFNIRHRGEYLNLFERLLKSLFNNFLKQKKFLKKIPQFFARKFDPIVSNEIINKIDESIYGKYEKCKKLKKFKLIF